MAKSLLALVATLPWTARGPEEVWLTLTNVCQAIESVLLCSVEARNERVLILDFSPAALNHAILRLAVPVRE